MSNTAAKANSTSSVRTTAFVFILLAVTAAALWVGQRMAIQTDPDNPLNLAIFLLALLVATGSLGAIATWGLWARRWAEPKRYQIALRQGTWIGLFVALVALLQAWQLLSWLVVGAILLILIGLEALLLLQPEPAATPPDADEPTL